MRVAVIVALMLVLTASSQASNSCTSTSEAENRTGCCDELQVTSDSASWLDRWVDVAPVAPRRQAERPVESVTVSPLPVRQAEDSGMPHIIVVLAFFAFVMIFATIEIVLRNDEEKR